MVQRDVTFFKCENVCVCFFFYLLVVCYDDYSYDHTNNNNYYYFGAFFVLFLCKYCTAASVSSENERSCIWRPQIKSEKRKKSKRWKWWENQKRLFLLYSFLRVINLLHRCFKSHCVFFSFTFLKRMTLKLFHTSAVTVLLSFGQNATILLKQTNKQTNTH